MALGSYVILLLIGTFDFSNLVYILQKWMSITGTNSAFVRDTRFECFLRNIDLTRGPQTGLL